MPIVSSLLPMHLDESKTCFVCGPQNPKGLGLDPCREDEKSVVATYIAPDYLRGYRFRTATGDFRNILHGGISCALLDCLGAWIVYALRKKLVVTTEFKLKLLKPVFTGEKMHLRVEIVSDTDDDVTVRGEIRNCRRELCTTSRIKYRVLSEELQKKLTNIAE